ncbi:MAG: hypothetical protein JJU42_01970 [Rhodobacteraceae bacterium]|nr:hypothetical protein [Paracoccaceae bacterium]
MHHDWIIEVLEDLRAYSRENRLHRLAEELAALRLVALTEIASSDPRLRAASDSAASSGAVPQTDHDRPRQPLAPFGRNF